MNKMPMRRICETAAIRPATLYSKIDFIYRRCIAFAATHEQSWRDNPKANRVYLSLDRQEYIFNWGTQLDRNNTLLIAVTSVDNNTGYSLSLSLDFDPSLNSDEIEAEAVKLGDYDLPYSYRHFARLWLQRDYSDRTQLMKRLANHRSEGSDSGATAQKYKSMLELLELGEHSSDEQPKGRRPSPGVQVRSDYTLYGHMFFLNEMLAKVDKVRIFMDREASAYAACMAAFGARIQDRTADAFFIRMKKNLTVDQKRLIKAAAERKLTQWLSYHPEIPRTEASHMVLRERIEEVQSGGNLSGVWIPHPFSDMAEPDREMAYLTDLGGYDADHLARLYNRASLRGVDRFLMLIRRRLSIFERPIHTASTQGRVWYGYSGYNPAIGAKLLSIFRIFHNFALPGEDGVTPAVRLGVAQKIFTLEELLADQTAS